MTAPKDSSVMEAAAELAAAHERAHRHREELRNDARLIRRALAQLKRLTEPKKAPRARREFFSSRPQPPEPEERTE